MFVCFCAFFTNCPLLSFFYSVSPMCWNGAAALKVRRWNKTTFACRRQFDWTASRTIRKKTFYCTGKQSSASRDGTGGRWRRPASVPTPISGWNLRLLRYFARFWIHFIHSDPMAAVQINNNNIINQCWVSFIAPFNPWCPLKFLFFTGDLRRCVLVSFLYVQMCPCISI